MKGGSKGPDLKIGKEHEYANHLGETLKDEERSPQAALGEIEAQGLKFETKISVKKLGERFSLVFKTITVDKGSEFTDVDGMERSCLDDKKKRLTVDHCHPYCSNECSSNEKQNGMARRHHPKGTDLRKMSKKKLRETTA